LAQLGKLVVFFLHHCLQLDLALLALLLNLLDHGVDRGLLPLLHFFYLLLHFVVDFGIKRFFDSLCDDNRSLRSRVLLVHAQMIGCRFLLCRGA